MMNVLKRWMRDLDLTVIVVLVALAVLLGVLNNLRVPHERKVGWFGGNDQKGNSLEVSP